MNTSDITINNTMNNDIYTNNNNSSSSNSSMYTSKVSIRNEPRISRKGHNYDPYNSDPSSQSVKSNLTSNTGSNTSNIRLPKLMNMYASRACRSAVMIGTLGQACIFILLYLYDMS